MSIGKVNKNGTFNNGAFYSIPDVNTLVQNSGGGSDLPTPTVADAGKAVIVDEEGKYALGEGGSGSGGVIVNIVDNEGTLELDKTYNEIKSAILSGNNITFLEEGVNPNGFVAETSFLVSIYSNTTAGQFIITLFKVVTEGQGWKLSADSYVSTTADGVLIKA